MSSIHHAKRLYVGTSAERTALSLTTDGRGIVWYDTDQDRLYTWSGSAWVEVTKISEIYESDGGGPAWQTDASGHLSATGKNLTTTGDISGASLTATGGDVIITNAGRAFRGDSGAEPTIGTSATAGRIGNIYIISGAQLNALNNWSVVVSGKTLATYTEGTQDTVEIGDVGGGGDVDVSLNDGQVFLEGSSGILTIDTNEVPVIADSVTKTVQASGGDFTTIQDAVDWFKNKLIVGACIIDVEAGTYDEAVVFQDIFCGNNSSLTLRGDTRELAGMSYVDGAVCNRIGKTNGGSGTVSLSNSGTTLTVTMSTTNPDFDADGWGNGDKIIVYDNAGTTTEFTISSVLNNVITLTTTAPTIGNDATAIVLKPNRLIDRSTAGPCIQINQARGVVIDGFYLESATGANCNGVYATYGASVFVQNCLAIVEDYGFIASGWFSSLDASAGDSSAWGCNRGFYADPTAQVLCQRTVANNCVQGYIVQNLASLAGQFGIAVNCTTGFLANANGNLAATSATARQCTTGYSSATGPSFLNATTTNANNNGNGTNYSPAPTVPGYAQGTDYAVLFAS